MARRTFPHYEQVHGARLKLEADIKSAPRLLPAQLRMDLIRAPFVLLSPQVERQFSSTHIDREVGLTLGAWLLVLSFVVPALGRRFPDSADAILMTALVAGLAMVVWQGTGVGPRYIRRRVVPTLARALAPLHPSDGEIGQCRANWRA